MVFLKWVVGQFLFTCSDTFAVECIAVSFSHNTLHHRQTDRETNGQTDRRQHDDNSQSYCVSSTID